MNLDDRDRVAVEVHPDIRDGSELRSIQSVVRCAAHGQPVVVVEIAEHIGHHLAGFVLLVDRRVGVRVRVGKSPQCNVVQLRNDKVAGLLIAESLEFLADLFDDAFVAPGHIVVLRKGNSKRRYLGRNPAKQLTDTRGELAQLSAEPPAIKDRRHQNSDREAGTDQVEIHDGETIRSVPESG